MHFITIYRHMQKLSESVATLVRANHVMVWLFKAASEIVQKVLGLFLIASQFSDMNILLFKEEVGHTL